MLVCPIVTQEFGNLGGFLRRKLWSKNAGLDWRGDKLNHIYKPCIGL